MVGTSGCVIAAVISPMSLPRLHQRSFAAGTDESDDFSYQGIVVEFVGNHIDSFGEHPSSQEQFPIGSPQPAHFGAACASAL
jgi:hypothetical protein